MLRAKSLSKNRQHRAPVKEPTILRPTKESEASERIIAPTRSQTIIAKNLSAPSEPPAYFPSPRLDGQSRDPFSDWGWGTGDRSRAMGNGPRRERRIWSMLGVCSIPCWRTKAPPISPKWKRVPVAERSRSASSSGTLKRFPRSASVLFGATNSRSASRPVAHGR